MAKVGLLVIGAAAAILSTSDSPLVPPKIQSVDSHATSVDLRQSEIKKPEVHRFQHQELITSLDLLSKTLDVLANDLSETGYKNSVLNPKTQFRMTNALNLSLLSAASGMQRSLEAGDPVDSTTVGLFVKSMNEAESYLLSLDSIDAILPNIERLPSGDAKITLDASDLSKAVKTTEKRLNYLIEHLSNPHQTLPAFEEPAAKPNLKDWV